MPKSSEYPNLRTYVRKGSNGQTWTSYAWDGRSRGARDVPLGNDFLKALEGWRLCQQGLLPMAAAAKKLPKLRQTGKRRTFAPGMFDSLPAWGKSFYLNAERRAAEAERPFTLTVADLVAVIERANGRCEVSGLFLDHTSGRDAYAPSVDRIDCARGYEKDNIRIVALIVNLAMNTWGEGPLMRLAEALTRKRINQGSGSGSATPNFAEQSLTREAA